MSAYVELVNGKTVARDAEEWRDECLARWVLQIGRGDRDNGNKRRAEWIRDYQKKHGYAEADKLQKLMQELQTKC